jgi:hypothetical protein
VTNSYKTTIRIDWERARLALGWALNSTIIIAEHGCDVRTALRDIRYLREFYGSKLVYNHKDRAFYLEPGTIVSKDDMRAHYGKSLKTKALYNRAIRAECPGGNELLSCLELVSAMRGRARDDEELDKLTVLEDQLQNVRERMLIDVRTRWGLIEGQLPPAAEQPPPTEPVETSAEFAAVLQELGLSQTDLGGHMGMTRQAVNRIVNGERQPTKMMGAFIRYIQLHPPE